jgi:hypothetical protein
MGGDMLASDIGLVQSAMTALNAPPDLIEQIVALLETNSEELGGHVVTRVGADWFGGAPTGHRIGVNAEMAHQAVEEEFQKLADALRQYSTAITQWAEEVQEVDATSGAEMTARAQVVEQVNATLEQARDEAASSNMGDGRYTEPTTTGSGS